MGITVFTPALLIIGGLCTLALLVTALNFTSLQGVKTRMVTQAQQEAFGNKLLLAIGEQLSKTADAQRAAVESLRDDYRTHVTEIAEVKASHAATVRQFDQMMASYTRLHQLLVARLLDMASGRATSAHAADPAESSPFA